MTKKEKQAKLEEGRAKLEELTQSIIFSREIFTFDNKTGKVTKTTEEKTLWQGVKGGVNNFVDDVKKAPLRKRALKAIADNALEDIYAEIKAEQIARREEKEAAKAAKVAAKEAAARTKLETVVEKADATATA